MILEILIFLLTTIFVYYLYSYKKVHDYFRQRDVKFLKGLPVFGNVFKSSFLKRHYVYDLDEVYRAFPDERYVGFIEMTKPIVLIRDPELIKQITIKDFDHFTDHKEFFSEEIDPLFGGSLFSMTGDRWRVMRNTLSPAFTSSKMRHMLPFMNENSNNVVEFLKENTSKDIDVDDLTRRYTNDVIASAGFGLQVNSVKDRDNQFYKIGSTILEFTFRQRMFMIFLTLCPTIAKKLGIRLFSEQAYSFFTNIVESTMEYRKKEKIERPDMIQLLMETPRDWTAMELTSQVFIFFIAGFETSASVLSMTIHELALNPDIQEKLYREIRTHKEEKELTFENINDLKYLECVVNETLRKWSPGIFMNRTCVKTYELPPPREGSPPYVLKQGDVVFNMINCLLTDPKHFPDPEKYDPERFSEENKHNITPFTYMPFGNGPRICIGMRFAIMEIKVLLYHILLNFKIKKCPKTADPPLLAPHSFNIRAQGGTWVSFEERS